MRLPPLRQRREDIPVLMEHFLGKYGRDFQRPVPSLSEETHRLFQEYSWPGNVRELENAAKAIVALGDEAVAMGGLRAMLLRPDLGGNGSKVSLKQASRAASREAEKEIILRALTRTRWNRRRAGIEACGPRSVRINTAPLPTGAGRKRRCTVLPVRKPMPSTSVGRAMVRWLR